MKLSDAIRAGAKMHPQVMGKAFDVGPQNEPTGSCAIGAAIYGAGLADEWLALHAKPFESRTWEGLWLNLFARVDTSLRVDAPPCPRGCDNLAECRTTLAEAIAHLNDDHRWTREAIAQWIEETFEVTDDERAARVVAEIKASITEPIEA